MWDLVIGTWKPKVVLDEFGQPIEIPRGVPLGPEYIPPPSGLDLDSLGMSVDQFKKEYKIASTHKKRTINQTLKPTAKSEIKIPVQDF